MVLAPIVDGVFPSVGCLPLVQSGVTGFESQSTTGMLLLGTGNWQNGERQVKVEREVGYG